MSFQVQILIDAKNTKWFVITYLNIDKSLIKLIELKTEYQIIKRKSGGVFLLLLVLILLLLASTSIPEKVDDLIIQITLKISIYMFYLILPLYTSVTKLDRKHTHTQRKKVKDGRTLLPKWNARPYSSRIGSWKCKRLTHQTSFSSLWHYWSKAQARCNQPQRWSILLFLLFVLLFLLWSFAYMSSLFGHHTTI